MKNDAALQATAATLSQQVLEEPGIFQLVCHVRLPSTCPCTRKQNVPADTRSLSRW